MTSSQQSRFQTYTRKLLSNTLTVVKDFDVTDLSTLDEFVPGLYVFPVRGYLSFQICLEAPRTL